jgi:SRSO17 transposase
MSWRAHYQPAAWQRISAGADATGDRLHRWVFLPAQPQGEAGRRSGCLVCRSLEGAQDRACYTVFAPRGDTLEELVRVVEGCWAIEIAFESAKHEVGLDQYEVRK